jgi:hypothetical protein
MPFNFEQTVGRTSGVLGWPSRITGLTKVLGGILFFALLHHPVQTLGATVPAGSSVTLTWNPNMDPNVAGYNVYYGVASHAYTQMVNVGNVSTATISGLVEGATYYFAVTAYDSLGQESDYSNETSYTVPAALAKVQLRSAPAGQFILTLTGPVGRTYEILATQDFTAWTVISTVTLGATGSLDFTDTNAASFSQRFYRTQEKP